MGNEWHEQSLGELIDIKHGFAFKGEFFQDNAVGDILLTPGNFVVGGGFKPDKFKFYNGPVPDESVLSQGDLIITMTDLSKNGDTLGYPAIVPSSDEGYRFLHNQRLGKVIIKNSDALDSGYLYYLMCSQNYRHEVLASATGTTVKHTAPERIKRFRFGLPPLPEQRRIAHILGTLDDKIELNRQMNETLEAIARAIFKSWFVDFDPVRAKIQGRKPDCMDSGTAALFPSAFQDSALGQIPKGWEVDQVKNRASRIQYGFTQSASEKPVGPKFLRITDIASRKLNWASVPFCHITEKDHDKYKLQEGDILVARTGATTGANIYIVDPPDAVFASYLVRIQFHNLSIGRVVGEFMSSQAYDNYVISCIGGSAQPNANAQLLSGIEFVFPPPEIAKRFYEKVHALDKKRAANDRQSLTLSQIREALLPKLLSGEIRVRQTDERLEVKDGGTS